MYKLHENQSHHLKLIVLRLLTFRITTSRINCAEPDFLHFISLSGINGKLHDHHCKLQLRPGEKVLERVAEENYRAIMPMTPRTPAMPEPMTAVGREPAPVELVWALAGVTVPPAPVVVVFLGVVVAVVRV
jgi:hypothetical protein